MFKRKRNGWSREAKDLRREQLELEAFLQRAPALLQEERSTLPPPEELLTSSRIIVPTRREFRRIRAQYYLYGLRLVITMLLFALAALWFVNQLLRHTYLFE